MEQLQSKILLAAILSCRKNYIAQQIDSVQPCKLIMRNLSYESETNLNIPFSVAISVQICYNSVAERQLT